MISGSEREFKLRAKDETIAKEWVSELKRHINLALKMKDTDTE
jgi:hypothetical protein